jgi:ABC-type Zn uptake system ZnuABC Zn-binding protein ZnuA
MARLLLLAALCAAVLASCGSDDPAAGGAPHVVATTTQVADLARTVAGDRARVTGLLRPGSDPHDYEPRPSDARALAGASLVLRSGGDVDDWLGDLLDAAGSDARTIVLLDAMHAREGAAHEHEEHDEHEGHDHGDDEVDPHWWQDPRNAEIAVRHIRDGLAEADPGGAATYRANAERLLGRIRALDAAIARCMARVPAERRRLVTNHDSLGYFAARYDITVVGAVIPALSTAARASAGETRDLVETIRRERVSTIFPASSVNPRLEKAIAAESGAEVGDPLWADTLGPEGSAGATYLGALRADAASMAAGFSGGAVRCDLPR